MSATDHPRRDGGTIPGTDLAAFSLHMPAAAPVPILIAAPHGGRIYPPDLTARMRDPAYASHQIGRAHV